MLLCHDYTSDLLMQRDCMSDVWFFFFKQKTAYEMRISDWSSDVCSSDLTLGTTRDAQLIDAPGGESKDPFLFHYNFPPLLVGEAGRFGAPMRPELGHGRLAQRGLLAVKPSLEELPCEACVARWGRRR